MHIIFLAINREFFSSTRRVLLNSKLNQKIPPFRDEYTRRERLRDRDYVSNRSKIFVVEKHKTNRAIQTAPTLSQIHLDLRFSALPISLSLSLVLPRRSKTQQVIIQTFERRQQSPLRAETEAQSGPSSFPRVISPKSVPPSPLRVDCSTLLILSAIFAARIPSSCEEGRSIKI